LAADLAAAGNDADGEAAHLAAEAAAFAAWARGDLAAARAEFAAALQTDDTCCCTKLGSALVADPPPTAEELGALIAPVTDRNSDGCSDLSCWLRQQATAPTPRSWSYARE
jgi:hypothetical protein